MSADPARSGPLLATRSVAKVWGRTQLPAPFARIESEPVGEIWFEPGALLPDILIKYLFTSARLSVQVHPRAGEAGAGVPGKDECWLVLDAEPGARLAIGFDRPITRAAMRTAALDGSIAERLVWHEAAPGDFFYLPAGTVHAIGAGISLIEVQQNTDITYRLFDYGRPRDLHLDQALAVASGEVYRRELHRRVDPAASACLVEGPHFRVDHLVGVPGDDLLRVHRRAYQVLPLEGCVEVDGVVAGPGESAMAASLEAVDFAASRRCLAVGAV
ncbi:class I mannose-6-phosphate isomerase [Qipengyuania sp. DY56-A-20]|uniref:Class I mannose-6-phosphate isomerase n=1 Tax=Qipengyuania benthica TaxID=3067651 RepID=A0ABT9H539_9SPHN|nr:class I mannose-6-phosphate isomerase [Qipengyuania sp. DY56-A-20]MBU1254844.1 class I mannose-6-phosphate isomerase [Alphaproteobacteria bacterium]MBU1607149.1 class I mannose-6-phosphate isomerase [Alphaproteobacteria bacterium]MDP4538406.1 class I mannose-6-phosphate isomerase [Qipengyuania sp. DY56-A-20]